MPTAAPTPVGARYSPNTSRRVPAHSPVVPPAWARAMVAGITLSPDAATRRQLVERSGHGLGVALGAPFVELGDGVGLDRGVDPQDRLLTLER